MALEAKIYYPETDLHIALKASLVKAVLKSIIQEGVRSPELITAYWQTKLQVDAERAGLNIKIEVPGCDWTEGEIRRPMKDIKGNDVPGLMVPVLPEITLPLLGKMYPIMGSDTLREDTPVKDIHKTQGWIKVYAVIDVPNCNTPQSRAEKFAREQGYLGQREITYILASQASKDLSGCYLDERCTWSWLDGSRRYGEVVSAYFDPHGYLIASGDPDSEIRSQQRGWRFEEVERV